MSDSVRPHRWQAIRLHHSWDSRGKNTGVGCHFLLQCMKVKSESEVPQSCLTLSDPMDCSLPGSFTHGIFQASVLEWGAIAFSINNCILPCNKHLQLNRELDISCYWLLLASNEYFTQVPLISQCQRRQWHPTPVHLPGKSHGRGSLVGCSPCGRRYD